MINSIPSTDGPC